LVLLDWNVLSLICSIVVYILSSWFFKAPDFYKYRCCIVLYITLSHFVYSFILFASCLIFVMDRSFDLVSDVLPGREAWRIKVRIIMIWEVPTFLNQDQTNSVEMVLIYEEVCLCCYVNVICFLWMSLLFIL
jgi:hypothetical protein